MTSAPGKGPLGARTLGPWLVQLGGDRGGWYSWDSLDNGGRPSATEVDLEWQSLAVGDHVKYWTRRHGPVDAWHVAALEPDRFLGLQERAASTGARPAVSAGTAQASLGRSRP